MEELGCPVTTSSSVKTIMDSMESIHSEALKVETDVLAENSKNLESSKERT